MSVAQVTSGTGHTWSFLLSPQIPQGCFHHGMQLLGSHRAEAAELELPRVREWNNLGIPHSPGCASSPALPQGPFLPPGHQVASQLCLLGQRVRAGTGSVCSSLQGNLFFQAMIFL